MCDGSIYQKLIFVVYTESDYKSAELIFFFPLDSGKQNRTKKKMFDLFLIKTSG